MIRRYRPKVNVKAMWLSFIMLICSYIFSNFSVSVTGEPDILQTIELFKDYFDLGSPKTSFPDSIVLVNVSYDRELIPYNDGVNEGNIDITDRNKLIEFLTLARNTEYRYILLDIALDKRLLKDTPLNDSLYNTITTIPNLFLSKSEDFVTDKRLKQKGAWVDYCTNVFEETFTKVSIVEDDTVSLAMRIYEDQQKKHIKSYFNVTFSPEKFTAQTACKSGSQLFSLVPQVSDTYTHPTLWVHFNLVPLTSLKFDNLKNNLSNSCIFKIILLTLHQKFKISI